MFLKRILTIKKNVLIFLTLFISAHILSQSFFSPAKINIEERMKFFKVPSISISIVEKNSITDSFRFGDVDSGDLYHTSNFSMPITALAVFKLKESGLLDIDSNVNNYLKDWKIEDSAVTRNRKVTLRELLSHTAGIDESGPRGYIDSPPDADELLKKINIRYYPGLKRRFSWSGYLIIQKVIEDITGMDFDDYIRNEILLPLGMNESHFSLPERHVNGYDLFGSEIEGGFRVYPRLASSGLWSTTDDISKFIIEIQRIYQGEYEGLISKQSVDEMLSYQVGGWGLGLSLKFDGDNLIFRHSGKSEGFTCYFISRVVKGEAIVIMSNSDNAWKLIMEIIHSMDNYKDWGI